MPTAPGDEARGRVAKADVLRGASSGRIDLAIYRSLSIPPL